MKITFTKEAKEYITFAQETAVRKEQKTLMYGSRLKRLMDA